MSKSVVYYSHTDYDVNGSFEVLMPYNAIVDRQKRSVGEI